MFIGVVVMAIFGFQGMIEGAKKKSPKIRRYGEEYWGKFKSNGQKTNPAVMSVLGPSESIKESQKRKHGEVCHGKWKKWQPNKRQKVFCLNEKQRNKEQNFPDRPVSNVLNVPELKKQQTQVQKLTDEYNFEYFNSMGLDDSDEFDV